MELPYTPPPIPQIEQEINEEITRIPEIKQQIMYAMNYLEGWCSKEKAFILTDLIFRTQPQVIVEIGVFGGKSFVPMAITLKALGRGKIYGIDPWLSSASTDGTIEEKHREWWGALDHQKILDSLKNAIGWFDLSPYVKLIRETSASAAPIENIDILHIDGNHSMNASFFDVTKWVPLVNPGGWIIYTDIHWADDGVLTRLPAVEWLNAHCTKIVQFDSENGWGIWVK